MAFCKRLIKRYPTVAGTSRFLMAQVIQLSGDPITQANTESVTVDLYDITDGDRTLVDDTGATTTDHYSTPDVSDTISDTWQTDARWVEDSTGFNASTTVIAPVVGRLYDVRLTITDVDGNVYVGAWELEAE